MNELEKTKLKLKMMEISFEQINNSRNDMIKQLAEQEIINEHNESKVKNLLRVIRALEWEQDQNYSPERSFALSYLVDIRDDTIPKKMVTDKK